jgi:hypothetical protein
MATFKSKKFWRKVTMNDREVFRYEMFIRVCEFGAVYSDTFNPTTLGGEHFAVLGKVVDELAGYTAAQLSGNRATRQSTSTKAVLREELREDLAVLVRTVRAIAQDKPGLDDRFRVPRGNNDQNLISAARAFSTDAAPYADEFVRHELPADFLAQFADKIKQFEDAVNEQFRGTTAQVTATAAIDEAIENGMGAVRRLDAIVRNKFRDDPSVLAAWTSASHIERQSTAVKQPAVKPEAPVQSSQ